MVDDHEQDTLTDRDMVNNALGGIASGENGTYTFTPTAVFEGNGHQLTHWDVTIEGASTFRGLDVPGGTTLKTVGSTFHEFDSEGKIVLESTCWEDNNVFVQLGLPRVRPHYREADFDMETVMTAPVRVLCLGGSTRPGSSSEKALRVCADAAVAAGAEVDLILSRDLICRSTTPRRRSCTSLAVQLVEAISAADALIISSPGYHGAMSGMIKNALDYLEDLSRAERPYLDGMPVGCVAVAYGWQATVSTLHSLRVTVHALRGWPSPLGATINASGRVFDETGACVDESSLFQLQTVARQVVDFAQARTSGATTELAAAAV
jgi:FMN reductase